MNVFFKAGRALGRAEFLRLDNRNGAACLREAANDLLRSRVKELAPQAKALSAIAAAWESKKNQILTVTSAIRDQYLS